MGSPLADSGDGGRGFSGGDQFRIVAGREDFGQGTALPPDSTPSVAALGALHSTQERVTGGGFLRDSPHDLRGSIQDVKWGGGLYVRRKLRREARGRVFTPFSTGADGGHLALSGSRGGEGATATAIRRSSKPVWNGGLTKSVGDRGTSRGRAPWQSRGWRTSRPSRPTTRGPPSRGTRLRPAEGGRSACLSGNKGAGLRTVCVRRAYAAVGVAGKNFGSARL